MSPAVIGGVQRSRQRLAADPSRVVTMLFVPGQEGFDRQEPRTSAVVARILALDEDEVERSLEDVAARFETVTETSSIRSGGTPTNSPIASILDASSPRRVGCCSVRRSPASTQ